MNLDDTPGRAYSGASLWIFSTDASSQQVKWIEAIEFVDDFKHLGSRQGGYNEDHEFYSWRDPI
jgi:methionine sulfoxide reductase catalytic subunit